MRKDKDEPSILYTLIISYNYIMAAIILILINLYLSGISTLKKNIKEKFNANRKNR